MNERIQELAEQAGFDVKRLMEPYPGDSQGKIYWHWKASQS